MSRRTLLLCTAVLLATTAAGPASALVTLTDSNSSLQISATPVGGDSGRRGTIEWLVDGVNQAYQQWWWYRVGDSGPERGVESLGLVNQSASSNIVQQWYRDGASSLEVMLMWSLTGGAPGSGFSDLAQMVRIRNLTSSPLSFHWYQYCDLDLGGTSADAGVSYAETPLGASVTQTDGFTAATTSVMGKPGRWEIGYYDSIRSRLDDEDAGDLGNAGSGLGPGNLAWAVQWDLSIPGGSMVTISGDTLVQTVPEPSSLVALFPGAALLIGIRRRR